MGNAHCDVMYCKVGWCKDPHYQEKYGHWLQQKPPMLVQEGTEKTEVTKESATLSQQKSSAPDKSITGSDVSRTSIFDNIGVEIRSKLDAAKDAINLPFNCSSHPNMCKVPFNCHDLDVANLVGWMTKGYGHKGGDPRAFCMATNYDEYMTTCYDGPGGKGDLVKTGVLQYNMTMWGSYGQPTKDMDASYCFMENFCDDDFVTNATTLADADNLCDERFATAKVHWRNYTPNHHSFLMKKLANKVSNTDGFHDKAIADSYLKLACGMGNFHCDVMYCKEGYCKDPYYQKKYGHYMANPPPTTEVF